MNKNIEVINENLWAFNFEFVNMKFIQDVLFSNTSNSEFACLTNDGRILLNKSHSIYQKHLTLIKQIMLLPDDQLEDSKAFFMTIKKVVPTLDKYSDEQIEQIVQKYNLDNAKQVFSTCCELEKQRRKIKNQYIKGNKKPFDIKRIIKKFINRKVGEKNE